MRLKPVVLLITAVSCFPLLTILLYWLKKQSFYSQPHGSQEDLVDWPSLKEKQHHPPKSLSWNMATEVPIKKIWSQVSKNDEDYVSPEILGLSENPDIDIRAKFQQKEIAKMCSRHLMRLEQKLPIKEELQQYFRHFIFEDQRKAMFCFVPKIGCTNLKRLMLYMGRHLPLDTVDWPWVENQWYLEPALKHASLINKTLSMKSKITRFSSYYKFMFVRNPLERLVSAYVDKIEPPLLYEKQDHFPEHLKVSILRKYRENELYRWKTAHKKESQQQQQQAPNISVTFSEYIRNYVETNSMDLNEHFRPSIDICHPCLARFNFYGNFRNISTDVKQLIHKFETEPRFYRDESLHSSKRQTHRKLEDYFGRLTYRDRLQLLGKLYDSLLFYYTLYPSQRHSHYHLLGIRQPIT